MRPQRVSDDSIFSATREVLFQHGAGASLATIAARVGISAPALLHRHETKETLVRRSLAAGPAAHVFARLALGPDGSAIEAQLVARLLELATFLEQSAPALVIAHQVGFGVERLLPPGALPPPVEARRLLTRWLTVASRRVTLKAKPAVLAEALLGVVEARVFNRLLGGRAFAPGNDAATLRAQVKSFVAEVPKQLRR
jgi:AcrR family transcriptional regulator